MEQDTYCLKATIIVKDLKHPDAVFKALEPEISHGKRFKASLRLENSSLYISILAKDPTALRAAFNSYMRLLRLLSQLEEVI